MDQVTLWDQATLWWLATALAVLAELLTGTFYLLMLAIGLAAGALAAHLGLGVTAQMVVAAVCGVSAVTAWHLRRRSLQSGRPAPSHDPNLSLDIGQHVQVDHWLADGSARVHYRGAQWSARFDATAAPASPPLPGDHVIVAIDGSELLLGPLPRR